MKKILIFLVTIILLTILNTACSYNTRNPLPSDLFKPIKTYTKPSPTENLANSLKITFIDGYVFDDYVKVKYKITNKSDYHTFKYVKVKVSLLDEKEKVLLSDWTYAVGSEGLSTGDSNEFDIMMDKPSSGEIKYFRYKILEFD